MAKVLFINPVIRQNDKPRHIPYGLAQLVAIVAKEGHKVQVFDANAWRPTESEICEVLASDSWDVIAIGGLITTYGFIKKTVKLARQVSPTALIIAGGGFITPIPYEVMTFLSEIDVGVVGEAYNTLPVILNMVDGKSHDWSDVKGIIFRDKNGELHLNEQVNLLEDVDSLPFPAWHFFPLDIYFKNSSLLLSEEAMLARRHISVMASYGCPYRCKYCFHLGLSGELKTVECGGKKQIEISSYRKIRSHSPKYFVDLVKYAKERFGVDFVSVLDENFAALAKKKDWFDEFSDRWMKEGLQPACARDRQDHAPESCNGVHWGTTAHAGIVNGDMLKRFKILGCSHLDYGLESFSDEILKKISKGATVAQNEAALKMTIKAGIRPIPNQIIGFPDESFESIFLSIEAWERLGIQVYPFFATPYPGSEWYYSFKDKILEQYGGSLEAFFLDLGDATKITAVISGKFNAVELLGLRELMVNHDTKRIRDYERIWKGQNEGRRGV
ncbi:MAG: B12-binding domain-containing radical SAM protein [Nitrospirae bacterium]|nr:B12-binding domain-containing radical SAM protein [Nitrospirota bacterium]